MDAYTYGSPRVGNVHFTSYLETSLNNQTYRIVHHKDVVPALPPLLFGYRSVGDMNYIDLKSRMTTVCNDWSNERWCPSAYAYLSVQDHLTYFDVNTGEIALKCGGMDDSSKSV